jgi:hypothetical protein
MDKSEAINMFFFAFFLWSFAPFSQMLSSLGLVCRANFKKIFMTLRIQCRALTPPVFHGQR